MIEDGFEDYVYPGETLRGRKITVDRSVVVKFPGKKPKLIVPTVSQVVESRRVLKVQHKRIKTTISATILDPRSLDFVGNSSNVLTVSDLGNISASEKGITVSDSGKDHAGTEIIYTDPERRVGVETVLRGEKACDPIQLERGYEIKVTFGQGEKVSYGVFKRVGDNTKLLMLGKYDSYTGNANYSGHTPEVVSIGKEGNGNTVDVLDTGGVRPNHAEIRMNCGVVVVANVDKNSVTKVKVVKSDENNK